MTDSPERPDAVRLAKLLQQSNSPLHAIRRRDGQYTLASAAESLAEWLLARSVTLTDHGGPMTDTPRGVALAGAPPTAALREAIEQALRELDKGTMQALVADVLRAALARAEGDAGQ